MRLRFVAMPVVTCIFLDFFAVRQSLGRSPHEVKHDAHVGGYALTSCRLLHVGYAYWLGNAGMEICN